MSNDNIIEFKSTDKIPKNTMLCNGCPYWKFVKRTYLCKDLDEIPKHIRNREEIKICNHPCGGVCFENGEFNCYEDTVKCSYLNITDNGELVGLSDKVKQCGIGESLGILLQ